MCPPQPLSPRHDPGRAADGPGARPLEQTRRPAAHPPQSSHLTTLKVGDETGRNADVATQIEHILHEVAPQVEQVTGLAVPTAVYRLLEPRAWRRELTASAVRRAAQALPEEPEVIARCGRAARAGFVRDWLRMPAATVTSPAGAPQTLIAPRALHHTGVLYDTQALYRCVVHELVYHGQLHASAGAVVPPQFAVRAPGLEDPAVRFLSEGHAHWADQVITEQVFGEAVHAWRHLPRSWRCRLQGFWGDRVELRAIVKHWCTHNVVDEGAMFVEAAITAGGLPVFNRVWTNLTLVPSYAEITGRSSASAGMAWITRVAAA